MNNIAIIDIQFIPTLSILDRHYRADNVTVTVKWIPAEPAQHIDVLVLSQSGTLCSGVARVGPRVPGHPQLTSMHPQHSSLNT